MGKFVFLLIFILTSTGYCQSTSHLEKQTSELLDYYKRILPSAYLRKIKALKIEGLGSKRMDEFEVLLDENKTDPSHLISCVQRKYQSVSVTELSKLLNKIEKNLSENSRKFKCKATKDAISYTELKKIYSKLRSNKLFNNDYPAGNCFDRAYLISKELDQQGFTSRQLLINDYTVAAFKTKHGYKAESYPVHIVNTVKVIVGGEIQEYVLDPIYSEEPKRIQDYKKDFLINENTKFLTSLPQDYYENKVEQENCNYSEFELEVAKQNILHSQSNRPKHPSVTDSFYESPDLSVKDFKKKYFKP